MQKQSVATLNTINITVIFIQLLKYNEYCCAGWKPLTIVQLEFHYIAQRDANNEDLRTSWM